MNHSTESRQNGSSLETIYYYAGDIIASERLKRELQYKQHGSCNCYDHSVAVTRLSVELAERFCPGADMESLIKGALLHDYFLYDWRVKDKNRQMHGFGHAFKARLNAERDFDLSEIALDIIEKHMFPLNIRLPRYKESIIVCVADKICASEEVCRFISAKLKMTGRNTFAYLCNDFCKEDS